MATYFETGDYNATITDATIVEAKNGTPQVEIVLCLNYKQVGAQQVVPKTSMYPPRFFLALTEGTMGSPANPGWVAQTLKGLGFSGIMSDIGLPSGSGGIVGWTGPVRCGVRKGQDGNEYDDWKIVRTKTSVPAPDSLADKLTQKFGACVTGTGKAPVAVAKDDNIPDEKIPF
jgi:hypothetical protein